MSNLTGTGKAGLAAFGCLLLVGTFLGLSLILAKLADQAGAPRLTFLMVGIGGALALWAVCFAGWVQGDTAATLALPFARAFEAQSAANALQPSAPGGALYSPSISTR